MAKTGEGSFRNHDRAGKGKVVVSARLNLGKVARTAALRCTCETLNGDF